MHLHWLRLFERSCVCLSKVIPSATVSLLGVPELTPFPRVITSSTTTPTPLTGIRLKPCATTLWSGPSGHLAGPTQNTGYEPKSCIHVSGEHTPINLLTRKSSFQLDGDATIAASEDSNFLRHSGAAAGRKHSSHLVELGSVGTSSRKLAADVDHETIVPSVFAT